MNNTLTLVICLLTTQMNGQNTILTAFESIEEKFSINIFALEEYVPSPNIDFDISSYDNVEEALDEILSRSGLAYIDYDDNVFVIAQKDRIERDYTQEYQLAVNKFELKNCIDSFENK